MFGWEISNKLVLWNKKNIKNIFLIIVQCRNTVRLIGDRPTRQHRQFSRHSRRRRLSSQWSQRRLHPACHQAWHHQQLQRLRPRLGRVAGLHHQPSKYLSLEAIFFFKEFLNHRLKPGNGLGRIPRSSASFSHSRTTESCRKAHYLETGSRSSRPRMRATSRLSKTFRASLMLRQKKTRVSSSESEISRKSSMITDLDWALWIILLLENYSKRKNESKIWSVSWRIGSQSIIRIRRIGIRRWRSWGTSWMNISVTILRA